MIDSFRLRCDDEYKFQGLKRGVYNGSDPKPEFRVFLDLAEASGVVLPSWWSKEKREVCVGIANRGWSDIRKIVGKSDIQEHYGDATMPMKLRILGEQIYGKGFMPGC